jgi:hypothetical protein
MQTMYYIGVDAHKRTISYCVKDGSGTIHAEGTIRDTRLDLDHWLRTLPQPWTARSYQVIGRIARLQDRSLLRGARCVWHSGHGRRTCLLGIAACLEGITDDQA